MVLCSHICSLHLLTYLALNSYLFSLLDKYCVLLVYLVLNSHISKKTLVLFSNRWPNIYKSYTHSYISIYLNTLVEDDFRVGEGSSVLTLGGLPGSGKGCQGSKLCSILQVSEGCIRLCSLAAVDRTGTGGSALQALEKLPGSGKGCQGSKLCNILDRKSVV